MKQTRYMYIPGLVVIVLAAIVLAVVPTFAQDDSLVDPDRYPVDTITVSGNGSAAGSPDIATMQIGVETRNEDVSTAFDENNTTIEAVIETVVDAGVAREDTRTMGVNIYMERYPVGMMDGPVTADTEFVSNYIVNNQLRVVVRDIALVGDVMSAAVGAGANNIYGLSFGIEDQTELASEARTEAIENAHSRALELAELAGVELGEVLTVTEYADYGAGYGMAESAMMYGGGGGGGIMMSSPPVEPGQLSVTVQLQVTYRINH